MKINESYCSFEVSKLLKEKGFKEITQGYINTDKEIYTLPFQQGVYEHFSKYDAFEKEVYPTLIFDEIDKSLDIETVWELYAEFFPALVKKFNNQIIIVSHSPLVLSENIYNNGSYHIISMDEQYTNDVRKMLKNVKF